MATEMYRGSCDYQTKHAVGLFRKSAECLEVLLNQPGNPKDFLASMLRILRVALDCQYHLLASERCYRSRRTCKTVHSNFEFQGEIERLTRGMDLAKLFEVTLGTTDRTYGVSLTTLGDPCSCCVVRQAELGTRGGRTQKLRLLLGVFERTKAPDPSCPAIMFLTFDELFLRTVLLCIVSYVQHEHWARSRARGSRSPDKGSTR